MPAVAHRRRQPPHELFLENDRTGPQKPDAAHHLRRHAAHVERYVLPAERFAKAVLGHDHEQRAAERHEKMSPEPGFLGPILPVQPDGRTQHAG